jgi:pyruvate dehydrogenase E2 component (dihydrolipoamide acetyltransferase)
MAEVVQMPKLGFDMAEGMLVRWLKAEGEAVAKGEVLAEIETDKATVEVEASAGGTVRKLLVEAGSSVPIGTAIAVIGGADEPIDLTTVVGSAPPAAAPAATPGMVAPPPAPTPAPAPVADALSRLPGGVRASPIARRLAAHYGLDLRRLVGSGPLGRVLKQDVLAAASAGPSAPAPARAAATERIPLSRLRAAIGRRMQASKQQVPHFYLTAELDAAPMMSARAQANLDLPEDAHLSVNDFLVKAAALALRVVPSLNASIEGETITRHADINVGIAVSVDDGLLTVVARAADVKPLPTLSADIREMIRRAREGRVRPDDVEGSTFTISNLGMFDLEQFAAIINPPEAAILAVGSVREVPVVREGQIVPGLRLKVTLSADHRVTDGAEAARWLQAFRGYVEAPVRLFL